MSNPNPPTIHKSTGPVCDPRRPGTPVLGIWVGIETDQEDEGTVCRDVIIFDDATGLEVKRLDFCVLNGLRFPAPEVRAAIEADTLDIDVDMYLHIMSREAADAENEARAALAAAEREVRVLAQFD